MKKICSLFIALMAVIGLSAQNLENGFYLAGTMNGWGAAEGYHFVGNPNNPAEFMLETTLAVGDEFKVINYLNGETTAWYPNEGGNYVVDAAHAGDVTIYFQPDYKADWADFGGYFYVAVPEAPVANMTTIYEWPALTEEVVGITVFGAAGVESTTVKIHGNTDDVNCIKFSSSYVYADGKYIAIKPNEGGFKAGDVLSVAAVFNNSNDAKYAQVDLRAADGDTRIWLSDSASTINGRTQAGDPIVQTYTLESDQDSLLLGRYGNTAMCVTLLKVERAAEGGETPETIPTTAPAVPAQNEENVMAIYCNHYATNNANFGISGWAGGYQTLDLSGTMAAYWTGMTWECIIDPANTDAAHDFSAYENIHVDMWAPAAAKIKFTAEAVAGGNYKDGPVLDLVQGWNSFDIALADWAGSYDFANLKCFALEQYKTPEGASFEGNPFAIANIYFWSAPAATATYTVAGNNAELFNNTTWDPTNIANNMDLQEEGIYKFEKTDVTLPEGNIEFKVVKDHNWSAGAWPADNYVLNIPEAGVYTITITFNEETKDVAAEAVKTGDAQVDPVVSIAGSMNSWNASADLMTLAEDKQTASLTLNLAAQTYEFKVVLNGGDWRSNAQEFTRENATAAEMTGNLDNMHLVADVAGEYVFTWTFATNTLVITYPNAGPEPLTIPENAPVPTVAEEDVMAIYCNHYATNNANFGISGWAGGYQTLDLNGINVGYWTNMTWECIIDPAHTDDAHDFSAYKNLHVDLWAPLPAKIKFTAEAVAGGNYKEGQVVEMQQGWNNVDFVVAEWPGNYDFKNLKCFVFEQYQTLAGESFEGNPFAFANIYFYGKEEQGVENTAADAKVVKMIENGQLIIIKNGVRYNAQGAIVR